MRVKLQESHEPHEPSEAEMLARAQRSVRELGPVLSDLVRAFAERGESLYLVGGSVRDALLDLSLIHI